MGSPFQRHPEEETLERFVLGELAGADLEELEEHLLTCELCRKRLEQVDCFVQAMQRAAADLLDRISFVHQTEEGPVALVVRRSRERWEGRMEGREVESVEVFDTPRLAWESVRASFQQMFPEHQCGAECRAG